MSDRAISIMFLLLAACGGSDAERPRTFGGDRPVELQAPAMLEEGRRYPLLVVLHGYGFFGRGQLAYFGFSDYPDSHDMFAIAPDGLIDATNKQFWNADPACCDFHGNGVDDVAYLGGVIEDVIDAWPVDPDRVYLIGHSNGGFMSYRLACERSDLIAAIAVLAGVSATVPATCQPDGSVNVAHIHGTSDDTVPYDGGGRLGGVGAIESVNQWARHDTCGTTRSAAGTLDLENGLGGAETRVERADGCPSGVDVELWTIEGGGHVPNFGPGFTPAVWEWLTAHPRS